MIRFQSYATYIRGLDELEGPIHGLLTVTGEALRFETFERKSPLAALLPEGWRPKLEKVELTIPIAEIGRFTDLDGNVAPQRRRLGARLMTWLRVEPNGLRVEWGARTVLFDCERPVDDLLGPVNA